MSDYIPKPVRLEDLKAVIEKYVSGVPLRRRSATDTTAATKASAIKEIKAVEQAENDTEGADADIHTDADADANADANADGDGDADGDRDATAASDKGTKDKAKEEQEVTETASDSKEDEPMT
jgi:hypothetical protein